MLQVTDVQELLQRIAGKVGPAEDVVIAVKYQKDTICQPVSSLGWIT